MSNSCDKKKNAHLGHRRRMRERFAKNGFDSYKAHEVLEQILFNAVPRVNTNEIAHRLLEGGKSIMDVLHSERSELLKINGLGEKIADYIFSLIPQMSQILCQKYRELDEFNIYNIAFLGDWFLHYENVDRIGIIMCEKDGRFLDFCYYDSITDDNEINPYKTGDIIAKKLGCPTYYIITKKGNKLVNRSDILALRDYTLRLNSFMIDSYFIDGFHPLSILFNK